MEISGTLSPQKPVVLVVDDNEMLRNVLRTVLPMLGFTVEHARDGEEAIAVFRMEEGVDIVLIDVDLPGISGFETAKSIRAIRPVPCVFMTGGTNLSIADLGDAVIAKPFGTFEAVAEVLEGAMIKAAFEVAPSGG